MSRFCVKKARYTRNTYYTFNKFLIRFRKSVALKYTGFISQDINLYEKEEIIILNIDCNALFVPKSIDFNKILLGYKYYD